MAIFYFSGTGNTEFIAELIKDKMTKYRTDLYRIEDLLNHAVEADMANYEIIGIGFPSYGFNAPKIAVDFIKNMRSVNDKKCFLFLTCAGPCYLNNVAFFGVKPVLKRKGFKIIYEKTICMPANILLRYDDEMIKRIYEAATKRILIMTADISNNIEKVRNDCFVPYLFRWILILMERLAVLTVPLDFHVGKECDKCMKCVQECPRRNIRLNKDRIKYGLNCEACYRCVYGCPRKAIKGRLYDPAILKEGYTVKERFDICKATEIKSPLKGIFKTLEPYFNSQD
jgi:ferredoxin